VIRNRRAALDGLSKILDAPAPEDLFLGPEEEALFLYDLLIEAARARSSSYYWEICRTARRRGVTPEYVVDRASVLLGAMAERRRADLYRLLGVPPLASEEVIRHRWLEVAKRHHPDVGGDADTFRASKRAYEVLRDADRRAEYERFWLRALGPFERVAARDGAAMLEGVAVTAGSEPRPVAVGTGVRPVVSPPPRPMPPHEPPSRPAEPSPVPPLRVVERPHDAVRDTLQAAARLFAARAALDARIDPRVAHGLGGLIGRIEAVLAAVSRTELDELLARVRATIGEIDAVRRQLDTLASLQRRLPPLGTPDRR
jgi:hypothetical protein